jgi:hypothetical protein
LESNHSFCLARLPVL